LLLQALDRNGGDGRLYSIDIPGYVGVDATTLPQGGLPRDLAPGFLVPDAFRGRWTLIEGDARDELTPLLARAGDVGMFLHDSLHTYAHMMWEYTAVLPHMAPNGVIVSDDIAWNTAFWDFSRTIGQRYVIHRDNPNVGALAVRRERV
jgi:hypothetical protein